MVGITVAIDKIILEPLKSFAHHIQDQLSEFQKEYPIVSQLLQHGLIEPMVSRVIDGEHGQKPQQNKGRKPNRPRSSVFQRDDAFQRLFSINHKTKQ